MAVGIIAVAFIVALVAINYTGSAGKSSDMRARAATETIIDSDALLDASEQSIMQLEQDPVLNESSDEGADDKELEELMAL